MSAINENNHWLIRVGDGKHLDTSSKFGIWGVDSNDSNVKSFMGLGKSKNKACHNRPPPIAPESQADFSVELRSI